ncbi:Acetolactate synthase small subunit,mitochondrial [Wickerhamomyces ciferrii]|uniref:Acetolactate synthase small subunit,mitochondrial n=1 Tax=Wickerhamomyces ciferrii (strain ATCC 14091 / BCRC 22168 / CBS 111 / JCM 3599 / NBRC 0793 / NRRL Y-1031 F-60-10) TaxID=1206466 RepID=K0KUS2_WICCF|nr:Acetolactate synthase small subunit,mitochondrial [Wickerhamomyces ciferrii]CCH44923.1 Acetolactate synthase small subunit,mitochondrial [Wickerhamomyces ciferrii]
MSALLRSSITNHATRMSGIRQNSSSTAALAYKLLRNKKRPPLPTLETPKWSAESAVASILYESPSDVKPPVKQHVLNCLVQNEPGVLSLVSGTLAARGFNIDSLVVSNTEVKDLSRMTICLREKDAVIEQARRQIEGLVPVYAVLDYSNAEIIKRELLLARVSLLGPEYFEDLLQHHGDLTGESNKEASGAKYHPKNLTISEVLRLKNEYFSAIQKIVEQFGGKIVDISDRNCIVELSAKPSRISSFLTLIRPFGVLEVARSGMMALPRTPIAGVSNDEVSTPDADDVVDVSQLPPG